MSKGKHIHTLLNRLARLDAGEGWSSDLNPAQRAAMEYLSIANRFSRSPSHVANYLNTTRGTMTQTLKTLKRKGYISEGRSDNDKRLITYELTDTGRKVAAQPNIVLQAIAAQSQESLDVIENDLARILRKTIAAGGQKPFGVCRDCRYFKQQSVGGFCDLLSVNLSVTESKQTCHEQDPL